MENILKDDDISRSIEDSFDRYSCNYIFAGTERAIPFVKELGQKKNIPFGICTQPDQTVFTTDHKVYVVNILGEDKVFFPNFGNVAFILYP